MCEKAVLSLHRAGFAAFSEPMGGLPGMGGGGLPMRDGVPSDHGGKDPGGALL